MSKLIDQSSDAAERASRAAEKKRTRAEVVSKLFDIVGRSCRTQAEVDDSIRKLKQIRDDGNITTDEFDKYVESVTLMKPRTTRQFEPLTGRAKDAADAATIKSDISKMSAAEFADAWRKA